MEPQEPTPKINPPFYKKWWFLLICVLLIIGAVGNKMSDDKSSTALTEPTQKSTAPEPLSEEEPIVEEESIIREESANEEEILDVDTPSFLLLANKKEKFIIMLELVSECYPNNKISEDNHKIMVDNNLQDYVEYILIYKYEKRDLPIKDQLSPAFIESFQQFSENVNLSDYPETSAKLGRAFDMTYDVETRKWTLIPIQIYIHGDIAYYDIEDKFAVGVTVYVRPDDNSTTLPLTPAFKIIKKEENIDFGDGYIAKNAVFVEPLFSLMGEPLINYWRNYDDILEHNTETKEATGSPVYYIRTDDPVFN